VPEASVGPIVPVLIGPERDALRLSRALEEEGVIVTAIRPPTVPPGSSRLRVTLHARLDDAAIERALAAFSRARRALGGAE
jgi:8-amino-7-oxononanoate synthase